MLTIHSTIGITLSVALFFWDRGMWKRSPSDKAAPAEIYVRAEPR